MVEEKYKLSKAQVIGLAEAIEGYVSGCNSFRHKVDKDILEYLSGVALRLRSNQYDNNDIAICQFFDHMPYTRFEDLRRRAAQENAFRLIGEFIPDLTQNIDERTKILTSCIRSLKVNR